MGLVTVRAFAVLVLSVCLTPVLAVQRGSAVPPRAELLRGLPTPLDPQVEALGSRIAVAGRERTVLNGHFTDDKGKGMTLRVTLQLPGLVRFDGLDPGSVPLVFDGENRAHRNSRMEESLLEAFTSDTAEGMLSAIKDGAAVQLLGRRVTPERTRRGDADSSLYDVYEVAGTVPSSATGLQRLKQYSFDSETGLLARTQYIDEAVSPPLNVETRFFDWTKVDGSAYPGRVEHLENGHAIFSFKVNTISPSPRQDPSSFR